MTYNINDLEYGSGYLRIYSVNIPNRKTPILHITNKNGELLGTIRWYAPWRKFCFHPAKDTIWDYGCIKDIADFLKGYNEFWKSKSKDNSHEN